MSLSASSDESRSRLSFYGLSALTFVVLAGLNNLDTCSLLYHSSLLQRLNWGSLIPNDIVPLILAALGISLLSGLGAPIVNAAKLTLSHLEHLFFSFAVGVGVAGLAAFALGLCHGFSRRPALVAGIVFLIAGSIGSMGFVRSQAPRDLPEGATPLGFLPILYGAWAYALGQVLVLALAPPTEWDVLAYHLALPKLYLMNGGVSNFPWMLHSHWPHLLEMLYTAPLALSVPSLAALLHASLACATVLAVYAVARDTFDVWTARVAATLMLAQPLFLRFAGTAHADAGLTFFSFLSMLCAWRWRQDPRFRWIVMAGIFMGWAASCKLHGLVLLVTLAVSIVSFNRERSNRYAAAGLLIGCGLLIVSPWLVKTWIWDGNPIWPFGASWFGGHWGGPLILKSYVHSLYWSGHPPASWWTDYQALYVLVPILVWLGVALWQRRLVPPMLKFFAAVTLPYAALLIHHTEFWRFLWPVLPVLALFGAWVLRGAKVMMGVAGVGLAVALWPLVTASPGHALLPVLGVRSASQPSADPGDVYLERSLDLYPAMLKANSLLKPNDHVLLFKEIRGYYLDVPYQWGDPINQGLIFYPAIADSDALYRRVRELGLTHVLVGEGQYSYDARTTSMMSQMLASHATLLFTEGTITVYVLRQ